MRRRNAEGVRSWCIRGFRAIALTFVGILLTAVSSDAGVLAASWIAPTTNTDGSALIDLALYRVYYSASSPPCPGSIFVELASSDSNPPPNETVSFQLTGLTTGAIYSVSVTALDAQGNESACSGAASGVAQDDSATAPTSTVTQDHSAPAPTGNVAPTPTNRGTRRHGRRAD